MQRIADLISLPEIKTVIHLNDAFSPEAENLLAELVFTREINRAFNAIYHSLLEEKGKGFFIEGGYGSGKSHFLVSLYLYLTSQILPPVPGLPEIKGPWLVVPISLLDYSNEIRLQEIVLDAFNQVLEKKFKKGIVPSQFIEQLKNLLSSYKSEISQLTKELGISEDDFFTLKYWPHLRELFEKLNLPYRPVLERHSVMEQLRQVLKEEGYKGAILLLDELSEFLKSKPTISDFQEDIRFLQFLGEIATNIPLWVVATLQEQLETTGDVPQDAYAKIKDRYSIRLVFSGTHIEEIVSERLVKKNPQARAYLEELFLEFKKTFNYLPFNEEQWIRLYPVHPLTIQLLDELRGLFSQHRGAIDFVYSRLKGDKKRNIPALLDAPPKTLLSPTLIFDHFLDRIRETLETNPYYEKVYRFYEKIVPRLFNDIEMQKVAISLIKLLILLAISPIKHKPTIKDLTLALLYPFTDLDPSLNFRFIHDILIRLQQEGAYLRHETGKEWIEDRFYLDLEEDTRFLIRTRFHQLKQSILPGDERIYNFVFEHAVSSVIPFKELKETQEVNIIWQNTRRNGVIYFLPAKKLSSFLKEIDNTKDFHLFILRLPVPENFILPSLPKTVGVWVPEKVDEKVLKAAFIYGQLVERYQAETTREKKLREAVKAHYEEAIKQATQEIVWAYRQGTLYFSEKETTQVLLLDASQWLRLLEGISAFILEKRYPLHHLIAPHMLPPPLFQRQQLVDALIIPGEITLKREDKPLKILIEGLLRPLGILKKIPGGYRVIIESSRSPLVKFLLAAFEDKTIHTKDEIFNYLRFSEFGLCLEQCELLLLAFIHRGLLAPYRQGKYLTPAKINLTTLDKIDTLEITKTLSSEDINLLVNLPFLPEKLKGIELTVTQQTTLWDEIKRFKENLFPLFQGLKALLTKHHPALVSSDLTLAKETLEQFENILNAIKVSLPATEGLKRLVSTLKEITFIDILYARLQTMLKFYEKKERIFFIYEYLHHPDLQIPAAETKLSQLYEETRSVFKKNLLFNPSLLESLEEKFNKFYEYYVNIYEESHNLAFSQERFHPYLTLRQDETYKLLKNWATLPVLPARAYLEEIEAEINQVLKRFCQMDVKEQLEQKPICSCNFKLGEVIELPPASVFLAKMQQGINACFEALKTPPLKSRLEAYMEGLKEIGKKEQAKQIKVLLSGKGEIKDWLKLTSELKKALSEGIKIVERNLDILIARLKGQSLPKAQLEAIFKDWLEGKEGILPDTYIRVTASTTGVPPALELALREREPDFLPLAQKWKERFYALLVYIAWCHLHQLPITVAAELSGLPETEWIEKQASLLKLAIKLLEEETFIQWAQGLEDEDALWQHLRIYQPNLSLSLEREKLFPHLKSRILAHLLESGEKIFVSSEDEETKNLVIAYQFLENLINEPLGEISTSSQWEKFYQKKISNMEWQLGIVFESSLPQELKKKLLQKIINFRKKLDTQFKAFYERQSFKNPSLPSQGTGLLLDGLRYDLYLILKEKLFPTLGYKVKEEQFYWAKAPTDTYTQLTAFGLDSFLENISPGLHLLKKGNLKIFKVDLIDTYFHQTHLFPYQVANEIVIQLKNILKPLLKGTKKLYLFSDHGFRLKLSTLSRHTYKEPLYTHGNISVEEVLVPWAVLE